MIETTQTVTVAAPLGASWDQAKDIERWAEIMPGYRSCEIIDADNSQWVLKVGVGGMVRTVTVDVHVERWVGPEEVDFRFALKGDPVTGSGTYRARALSPHETELALHVAISGTGPMAGMWEAMGGPVLPRFARSFAEDLKAKIEASADGAPAEATPSHPARGADPRPGLLARVFAWFRRLFS